MPTGLRIVLKVFQLFLCTRGTGTEAVKRTGSPIWKILFYKGFLAFTSPRPVLPLSAQPCAEQVRLGCGDAGLLSLGLQVCEDFGSLPYRLHASDLKAQSNCVPRSVLTS